MSFRYWLSGWICPERFSNEDANLEIDRLTQESEELRERIKELESDSE